MGLPVREATSLRSPVSTPGQWVRREQFGGRKSFGFFSCSNCQRTWTSAHAFREFRQGCQSCDDESYAVYMWENFAVDSDEAYSDESYEKEDREDRPHDEARCEACRRGVCRQGSSIWLAPSATLVK